jgi:hypothetical protein
VPHPRLHFLWHVRLTLGRKAAVLVAFWVGTAWPLEAAVFQGGAWSVEVTLEPDKPSIVLGEPTWVSFTVRNLSSENLQLLVGGDYQNELGRPSSFDVRVRRDDGQWVDQPKVGVSSGGLIGPKPLPGGETYVFRLFLPHWATFQTHGVYTIVTRRTLQLQPASAGANFAKEPITEVGVNAQTKLNIEPANTAELGRVIADYGETMLKAAGEKEGDDAVLALSWINDERVVPYFSRALAIRSYAIKFIAVQALAKFSTDEAFAALQTAMKTKASDFGVASVERGESIAGNIRTAAAGALLRSNHPKARTFLLAQRNDAAEGVRLAVVHTLGATTTTDTVPLLQEMTRDGSPRVSEEARRYLSLRQSSSKHQRP